MLIVSTIHEPSTHLPATQQPQVLSHDFLLVLRQFQNHIAQAKAAGARRVSRGIEL